MDAKVEAEAGRASEAVVRPAVFPQDAPAVRAILAGYFEEFRASLGSQDFEAEARDVAQRYGTPKQWLYVAERRGKVVGVVGLKDIGNGTGELKRMVVAPEARGHGLGRRLAQAAIEGAREQGWSALLLDTTPPMRAARHVYESLGFRERGPYYGSPLCGAVFMELQL